jgi:hypothetical protein
MYLVCTNIQSKGVNEELLVTTTVVLTVVLIDS